MDERRESRIVVTSQLNDALRKLRNRIAMGLTARFEAFAIEVHPKMKLGPVIAFCQSSCNAATGLPLPLDLVDQAVGIPRGFTREFVEEIEATLAKDPDLDKFELETRFSSLNPQKGE